MKALIATACVCVIAATGYYFVSEYQAHSAAAAERAAAEARIEAARQELFKMARAKPDETEDVKTMCKEANEMVNDGRLAKYFPVRAFVTNCRTVGYL